MSKPRLLDLMCGAGGATRGYQQAGFHVVGVDIEPQPNYVGDEFHQADALTFPLDGYDAIHASPPCQAHSMLRRLSPHRSYPDLIEPTRERCLSTGLPFVIENVVGAPLITPIQLCGSSFGLRIRRHRLFELHGFYPALIPPCAHHWQMDRRYPALNGDDRKAGRRSGIMGVYGNGGDKRADLWPEAMGIDWMTRAELTQAIPPAYTQWIGYMLMEYLKHDADVPSEELSQPVLRTGSLPEALPSLAEVREASTGGGSQ